MPDKIKSLLLCILLSYGHYTAAQPVQQWQDRNGEWHFGDPRAAPAGGSRDVKVQRPISVVKNEQPLPRYTPNASKQTQHRSSAAQRRATSVGKPSKADCEHMRDALRVNPTFDYHQRQQHYERECIIGVRYADSQQ